MAETPRVQTFATACGLVYVSSRPTPGRRSSKREAAHLSFVAGHWRQLTAEAYGGFREYGAGAVVLWREEKPRLWRPRPFEPERLWFATQAHAIPRATRSDFDGWEAEQIETYDPECEAVVVFAEGSEMSGYLVPGDLTPPEARVAAAASLD